MEKRYTAKLGDGEIIIETGKLAQQAGGAVTVRQGDSMVLVTATASKEPREGTDFFPLTVDVEERRYAVGKIPGGFFKREGRPSTDAILLARKIDRPLRPLFPKGYRNDVQIIVTPFSSDQEHELDTLAMIGASAALMISDIPFYNPVGAVRVGYVNNELVINPTLSQMKESLLDLALAGTKESVLMIETSAQEFPESLMLEAITKGHEAMQDVIAMQERMREEIGKEKNPGTQHILDPEILQRVRELTEDSLRELVAGGLERADRNEQEEAIRERMLAQIDPEIEPDAYVEAFEQVFKDVMRQHILETGIRIDGRDTRTIRELSAEVGLLPRAHGSGLFSRGQTQVMSIVTLGTASDEQLIEGLNADISKRYMHHYNFPPYSTGEAYPLRGPRRREIGHGALAEKAIEPLLPSEEEFPYTIRVVSEVLSSNGSTSMGSTCASSLALHDAGVPMRSHVAGIAMGVITEGDRWTVLTDIQGLEDHLGDMDFKVAGTRKGITAIQLDIKITGLSHEIIVETLQRAKEARLQILDVMEACIAEPRKELSPYAPRIQTTRIPVEKIGALIGPGGKTIRSIIEDTGVQIDVQDDGTVFVASADGESARRALDRISELTAEPEIGRIYTGKVVRTTDFGAFVEFLPGHDGLVHISQLADYRVPKVEDVVQVGDEVMVMVIDIDAQNRVKLSRQAVLEGWTAEEARARDRKPSGGGDGSSGGGGGGRGGRGGERRGGGGGGYRDRR
ncbi:MAG: polyribonucleotide nucleotidyltransferase [Chloroflexi bacterium]|nr:polyribonucleotide nucleotidyltransferase [Chloroflexota bacterium]